MNKGFRVSSFGYGSEIMDQGMLKRKKYRHLDGRLLNWHSTSHLAVSLCPCVSREVSSGSDLASDLQSNLE